ncbi:hypothetical protein X797_011010 [Metarhizium robertsii]|uniref:Uncharacterized protein n=1 Tax=Metarhizium robertsii TaxID=568076 RepID=A0A014N7U7_9HYPO|nr:hypothetical protein X797_011010 [Metarhizium robertsii]
MTTLTPRKNPLRACHQGIAFVNDEPTCRHKKRMVRIPKGFWACEYKRGDGSCERYLYFDEVDKVKPLRTPYKQQSITQFLQLPTPSTDGRSGSSNSPSRKPHQTNRSFRRQETAVASRSITIDRKRPISPDTQENSPLKKHQSGLQSAKDPAVRLLFPPTPYKRAANESHTDENDPSYFAGEDKFGKKSSDASSQTSNGGSRTSPRGVARVPLGNADINRV